MSIDTNSTPEMQDAPKRSWLTPGNIVLLVGIIAVALVFGVALAQRNKGQPTEGPAPDFTLTTLDGEQVTLSSLRGKVVLINFWASWCVPCEDEAPSLQAAWERYRGQDVVFLGVAWTDTERGARAFMAEYGQDYPNGLDLGTKIAELYGITGVPETFIVDKKGNVRAFYPTTITQDTIAENIDTLLAEG